MRNYPEWVMTFWAVQVLGAIAVPLNAWWTGDELGYALGDSQPRLLVADGERVNSLTGPLSGLGVERVIAVRSRAPLDPGVVAWDDELATLDGNAVLPDVEIGPDDDATIMYTSGTTGSPKGAIATQRNHATNLRNTELNGAMALKMAGIQAPADGPQVSMLQTFPFFHIGGAHRAVRGYRVWGQALIDVQVGHGRGRRCDRAREGQRWRDGAHLAASPPGSRPGS
jgi:long-chain acyl-CoA synthetase